MLVAHLSVVSNVMQSSQSTDEKTQDATEQQLNADQWQDHLAKLSDYGKQLYIDYRKQTGELAKTCCC